MTSTSPIPPPRSGRPLPLDGIRVLDFSLVLAGPYATMMLADMGAQVIRVESPRFFQASTRGFMPRPVAADLKDGTLYGSGYPDTEPGERPWNRYAPFNSHERNKLGVTVDHGLPEGLDVIRRLVEISDVIVENNTLGVMARLGLGYEQLRGWKPDIIMVSSSGFGATGPQAQYRAFGSHVDAMIGHLSLRGYADADPSAAGNIVISDAAAGPGMAFAAVAALLHRDRTGEGQHIEMSQAENLMHYITPEFFRYVMTDEVPTPPGNDDPTKAPQNTYRCLGDDNWVGISVSTDAEFAVLAGVVGGPLADDSRFTTHAGRREHLRELDMMIAAWAGEREARDIFERLQAGSVPCGILLDEADAYADPHLAARGFFETVTHPEAGTHRYPGMLWRHAEREPSIRRHAVLLGEDNDYVYRELLGVSDEEFARLEATGHISRDYLPPVVPVVDVSPKK
jgi:crotonobetainyl-CoA:carnitine CoA-transferase CaiB-like acyl-CoA transferase